MSDVVARGAEDALDAEHLVTDGVAVAERREHLVNGRPLHGMTAPAGTRAATSAAGGSVRRRRAKNPGSGSMPARATIPLLRQAVQHVEVFPLDHGPRVVGAGRTRGRSRPSASRSVRADVMAWSVSANSAKLS